MSDATSRIVRPYGDTTGDGMVQVSFTLPLPHDKRAEGAALQLADEDGHGPGAGRARQGDGPGLHLLRRLRPGAPPRRPAQGRGRRARVPAAHAQGGQRRDQEARCAASWSSSAPASAPTRTPSASTRSSTSRASPARRAWSTTARSKVVNLGAQVLVPELVDARPRGAGRRRAGLARSSPSATRTCTTPARCRRRSARRTRPARRRCSSSAARASTRARPATLGVDRIFGRGTTPGEVASYLVHELVASRTQPDPRGAQR